MNESHHRSESRAVVILGAGGYLGAALCQFFHFLPDYRVIAVSRRNLDHRHFDGHIVADVFKDDWADRIESELQLILINCAFDFAGIKTGRNDEKFARFEQNIAKIAALPGARLIHVSSMAAYPGCRSGYGREKLAIEALYNKFNGINVRPGLIMSWRRPGAAFLKLIDIVTGSRIVPMLAGRGSGFYVCDLDAVILCLYFLGGLKLTKPHTLSFCYRRKIRFGEMVSLIQGRLNKIGPKLMVPWQFVYVGLLLKEVVMAKSKVRADSIFDFAYPNPCPYRREFFAGVVTRFQHSIRELTTSGEVTDEFVFPELSGRRRKDASHLSPDVVAALGGLADTQGVGKHR